MKKKRAGILISALFAIGHAFAQPAPPLGAPLVPLCMSYSDETTHHVYTILRSDYDLTISHYGFSPGGIVAYMEPDEAHNTPPFERFRSPARTDTFLTDDPMEKAYVLANGWQFVRTEGHIYTFQVPGISPLHRIN